MFRLMRGARAGGAVRLRITMLRKRRDGEGGPMTSITCCIDDLRELARRRVPRAFFDYADRGSYAEETLRANREDLLALKLRQRVLVDVSERDLSTRII